MPRGKRSKDKKKPGKDNASIVQSLDSYIFESGDKMVESVIDSISKASPTEIASPPSGRDILESMSRPAPSKMPIREVDISPNEARSFILELKNEVKQRGAMGIYYHNDMDGLNAAIFVYGIARAWFGADYEIHTSPLEYEDVRELKFDEDMAYIFCDMDVPTAENIFRIDHHHQLRDRKEVNKRTFLLSPSDKDYDYPSTTTILAAYLSYIDSNGRMSFFEYMSVGPWHNDDFQRMMILLASVCDNLWHLSYTIDIPLKRWIPDPVEERNLILISISASLILGDEMLSQRIYREFFKLDLTIGKYLDIICSEMNGANNLFDFVMTVSERAEAFYNSVFFGLTDSLDRIIKSLERDRELLNKLNESMPIELRGNRDKMMELLKTKGDLSDQHWRRIKFYGKELENLESKINVDEKRLLKLRNAKKMISTEKGPKLCLYLPRQGSRQIKGILASIFYYRGWKNIVLEDRGSSAVFGARGFSNEEVKQHLSTLSMGFEDLKDYLNLEKVFSDLPEVFKRNSSLGSSMKFDKTYSGGIGGRGFIYGGSLEGKVPRVFSLLEESGDVEQKIKELMLHKELGRAMRGLTEGQSVVPMVQALRAKFKYTGWLVVQPFSDVEQADIQYGNFNMVIVDLAGFSEMFRINLRRIQKPQPQMEHGRFDIGS
ncbi:MAG: hypothetical protein QCI82_06625 [Candidatus Thermoplasmatota archaeon]|nr:hypothetical protein [Candidatus Thermoplasmatota archaeon]